jgi:hypothetical protein
MEAVDGAGAPKPPHRVHVHARRLLQHPAAIAVQRALVAHRGRRDATPITRELRRGERGLRLLPDGKGRGGRLAADAALIAAPDLHGVECEVHAGKDDPLRDLLRGTDLERGGERRTEPDAQCTGAIDPRARRGQPERPRPRW